MGLGFGVKGWAWGLGVGLVRGSCHRMQPAKAVCGDRRYTDNDPTGSMGTHLMQPAKAVPSGSKKRRMQSGVVTHATASHAMLSVQQSMQVGRPAGWIRGRRGQGGVGVWGGE